MERIILVILGVSLIALQFFLASRKNPLLGAIIPLVYLITALWFLSTYDIFTSLKDGLFTVFLALVGLILLLVEWVAGRNKYNTTK